MSKWTKKYEAAVRAAEQSVLEAGEEHEAYVPGLAGPYLAALSMMSWSRGPLILPRLAKPRCIVVTNRRVLVFNVRWAVRGMTLEAASPRDAVRITRGKSDLFFRLNVEGVGEQGFSLLVGRMFGTEMDRVEESLSRDVRGDV